MALKPTIVLDDLLSDNEQDEYAFAVKNGHWHFIDDMGYASDTRQYPQYGFCQLFKKPPYGVLSPLYENVAVPIINQAIGRLDLKIKDCNHCRAFLQVPLDFKFVRLHNGIHIDQDVDHYACVYYLNDADGDTIIYNETKDDVPFGQTHVNLTEHERVTPKQGRMVIFDGRRYHCSSQPHNSYRMILNYNLLV